MNKNKILLILLFNFFIAIGFYIENRGVGYSELSSDSLNAIPVCLKIDNQDLFKEDLYLNTLDNVKYYTPFYIETIRFFSKLSGNDYLQGMNLFATILHVMYGVFWFFGFYFFLKKDFWIAFLLSVIARGIVWLPGFEIWGISDLWTIMPRTFYITFLPIPFILLIKYSTTLKVVYFYFSCLIVGLIFNFHPITGIGGILLFLGLILGYLMLNKQIIEIKKIFVGMILMLFGSLPFILTYFSKTDLGINYDINDFNEAFSARIPSFFSDVYLYNLQWINFKYLFYVFPLVFILLFNFINKNYNKLLFIVFVVVSFVMLLPILSVYAENLFNLNFQKNIRMSFQLVRAQKVIVVVGLFCFGIMLLELSKYISYKLKVSFIVLAIFFIGLSKHEIFNSVPFLKDDISRSVFPNLSLIFKSPNQKKLPIDKLAEYIKVSTPKNAVFAEYYLIRCAAQRSVVLDAKGASMLIEGNPIQFINWHKDSKELNSFKKFDDSLNFYKKKGVDFLIFKQKRKENKLEFIHQESQFYLHKIK